MKNNYNGLIKINSENPIPDLLTFIRSEFSAAEKMKLVHELLKDLPQPPQIVESYAARREEDARLRVKNAGSMNATNGDLWELAIMDNGGKL
jgi:hypothetical protein